MRKMMSGSQIGLLVVVLAVLATAATGATERVVSRVFGSVGALQAVPSAWNLARGQIVNGTGVPDAAVAGAAPAGSVAINVDYSGKGFEHFAVETGAGKVPGVLKSVRCWARGDGLSCTWALAFKDAEGRGEVNKKKLEYALKLEAGKWVKVEFAIPPGWKQPVSLASIISHNWGAQDKAGRATLQVAGLALEAEVGGVAEAADLLKIATTCPAQDNIFIEGESPRLDIVAGSWLGRELSGSLAWTLSDAEGRVVQQGGGPVKFTDSWSGAAVFAPDKFGAYFYDLNLTLSEGQPVRRKGRLAYLPKPPVLTEAEKQVSPYGLNIHGGVENVGYNAIARLGVTWIRDYAYTYSWVTRAKGGDSKYNGWPWYPKMDAKIKESGLMLLPCLMGVMGDAVKAGKTGIDKEMRRELMMFIAAFPQYTAWEIDNEYDLHHGKDEARKDWSTYKTFHTDFGKIVKMMDDSYLAVEQGAAGIHPERVRDLVRSGAFNTIDVVNGHFYCGTQAPELNRSNFNTGRMMGIPRTFYDLMRDFAAAGRCDGRPRQAWITEFGWDTLAGQVVSEKEQAAYLQRGYLLGLQAGMNKMFWYWHRDTKKKPTTFFDGCGLLDPNDEPKPAAAALSALAHFIRLPHPVGTFSAGANGMGHVFRDGDKLVAAAFKIDKNGPSPSVEFKSGKLFDAYANPLARAPKTLDILPTWVVGLAETDPFYLQTAYDLQSRMYQKCAAGDVSVVEIRARNNRKTPLSARYTVKLPAGWSCDTLKGEVAAAPGETRVVALHVQTDRADKGPFRQVTVLVADGLVEKPLVIDYEITMPAAVSAEPLSGNPGVCTSRVTVANVSLNPKSFTVRPAVPASWKATPAAVELKDLASAAATNVDFEIAWNLEWKPDERAGIEVVAPDGMNVASCGLTPGTLRVPVVGELPLDGSFQKWPAASRLPAWAVPVTGPGVSAALYLAFSPKGLLVGVDVTGSDGVVNDPAWFWTQDTLEVFVEPLGERSWRGEPRSMHQFWLCPLPAEKRAYLGRWKIKDEIPAILHDVKEGVESFAARTRDGYVMQALIPASQIAGYRATPGSRTGIALVLGVNARTGGRAEVCWPRGKDDEIQYRPSKWGLTIAQ